jgi:mycothiol synthase
MTIDPSGLTWRPICDDVLDRLLALVTAVGVADDVDERHTLEDLADELGVPWLDPERDTLLAVDAGGTALAWGVTQLRPGDESLLRATGWGGVHPAARRRGIGRALLFRQESRGRELVARRRQERGTDVPARFSIYVDERVLGAAGLAASQGLARVRWSIVMRRDLRAGSPTVPAPELPAGLRLVGWSAALDEAIRLAHNEAFTDHWGSQPWTADAWAQWESGHRNFRGDWSFAVLTATGEVAGYALSAAYDQDWAAKGHTEGWTGKLGVRRPWRGRGLATALLAASMRAFAADGMHYAGLDVDADNLTGAVALYAGLGYQVTRRSATWAKDL